MRREPQRGRYDRETIDAILDEALVCHLGFVHDGHPYVIPTLFARIGDEVFVHGSAASRMLRTLAGGVDACLTVTLVDGLVLARSVFNHSVNYRSVVVLGRAEPVEDKEPALRGVHRAAAAGPLGRGPAADREGAEGDLDPAPAARRGVGEAARGAAEGRRRGLRLARVGRGDPARVELGRAGSGPAARRPDSPRPSRPTAKTGNSASACRALEPCSCHSFGTKAFPTRDTARASVARRWQLLRGGAHVHRAHRGAARPVRSRVGLPQRAVRADLGPGLLVQRLVVQPDLLQVVLD